MIELQCALCHYDLPRKVTPAVTVIEGFAVCGKHVSCVAQGKRWHRIMELLPRLNAIDEA